MTRRPGTGGGGGEGEGAVEAQLEELQRRYRVMEGSRRSYSEDSQRLIGQQRQAIEKLRQDNDALKAEVALQSKVRAPPRGPYTIPPPSPCPASATPPCSLSPSPPRPSHATARPTACRRGARRWQVRARRMAGAPRLPPPPPTPQAMPRKHGDSVSSIPTMTEDRARGGGRGGGAKRHGCVATISAARRWLRLRGARGAKGPPSRRSRASTHRCRSPLRARAAPTPAAGVLPRWQAVLDGGGSTVHGASRTRGAGGDLSRSG